MDRLPNPLGEPSPEPANSPMPTGDGFQVVSVVTDIIPVKITNWANAPSTPIVPPMATPPSTVPLLGDQKKLYADASKGMRTGLEKTGANSGLNVLGEAAKMTAGRLGVMAAGATVAGVALMPLGAAAGGVVSGASKGMGLDTVGKAFGLLGTVVAIQVLPAMMKLGASVLSLADEYAEGNRRIKEARARKETMGDTFDADGNPINRGAGDDRPWISLLPWGKPSQVGNWTDRQVDWVKKKDGGPLEGPPKSVDQKKQDEALAAMGRALGGNEDTIREWEADQAAKRAGKNPAGENKSGGVNPLGDAKNGSKPTTEKDFLGMMVQSFKNSIAPQASYSGIADVRQQAQLAALNEDPIDAQQIKNLLAAIDGIATSSAKTAEAVQPK